MLFPRAETVRGALADGLRAKGWRVDEVVAYRTVAGDPVAGGRTRRRAGRRGGLHLVVDGASGPSSCSGAGVPPVVVTIGPVTTGSARSAGLEVAAEADPHTIDGLVEAVVAVLGNRATCLPAVGPRPAGWHGRDADLQGAGAAAGSAGPGTRGDVLP